MIDSKQTSEPLVSVTDSALEIIVSHLKEDGRPDLGARLKIVGKTGAGFQYSFDFITPDQVTEDDVAVTVPDLTIYIDSESAENLAGAKIDFVTNQWGGASFQVDNPNPVWTDPISVRVQELIDTQINPGIASHGGFIELLDVDGDKAFIKMGGGCQGCGMADVTLKQGVAVAIQDQVPEIKQVIDTTDHASGANPYYTPGKGG